MFQYLDSVTILNNFGFIFLLVRRDFLALYLVSSRKSLFAGFWKHVKMHCVIGGRKEEKSWIGQNVQNAVINPKRMGKAVKLSESMSTDGSSTQSGCILAAAELKCTCARWRFDPRAQRIKECE